MSKEALLVTLNSVPPTGVANYPWGEWTATCLSNDEAALDITQALAQSTQNRLKSHKDGLSHIRLSANRRGLEVVGRGGRCYLMSQVAHHKLTGRHITRKTVRTRKTEQVTTS